MKPLTKRTLAVSPALIPLIAGCSSPGQTRPNVIIIMTDDHTTQALSCYQKGLVETPNLDRLASEGMLFERCYVSNAISGPSRACILTGKFSHTNGFTDNSRTFDGDQQTYWQPGDFVAIAFGHNDMKCDGKYRDRVYAAAKGAYSDYLRRFVKEVRAKGATPILMSPIRRGSFGKDGKLVEWKTSCGETLATYAEAARAVAKEQNVEFVDMHELTRQLLEKVGKAESDKFFVISTGYVKGKDGEPAKDVTHPIKAGAEAFAKLFIDDVTARKLSVAALFRDVARRFQHIRDLNVFP